MTWVKNIEIKLNIDNNTKTLIIDKTDILKNKEFKLYLSKINRIFHYSDNVNKIIEYSRDTNFNGILITKDNVNIPKYILKRFELKTFDYTDIPLNIDYKLYNKLCTEDIIKILNHAYKKPNLNITEDNLYKIIHDADLYSYKEKQTLIYNDINNLLEKSEEEVNYNDLLYLGNLWGKLIYLDFILDSDYSVNLQDNIDSFSKNYILPGQLKSLFYETFQNIKSVDKILPFIDNKKSNDNKKIALICFDCMGIAEWELLKTFFKDFDFTERYLFSLIPSITSISRGAIYSASHTKSYSNKINEKKSFNEFFKNNTVKHFREKDIINEESLLGIDIVNIIYNFFDDLSHNCNFPPNSFSKKLYFENLKNYIKKSSLKNDINLLINLDYRLYFCSDHGSVLAIGNGIKIEKYLQETFAKRACIIEKEIAKRNFNKYELLKIPFIEDKIVLLAENRKLFDNKGKITLSHGGISLDEIIVPFIEVNNNDRI